MQAKKLNEHSCNSFKIKINIQWTKIKMPITNKLAS